MSDKRDEPSAKDVDRKLHASPSRPAAQQAPVLGAAELTPQVRGRGVRGPYPYAAPAAPPAPLPVDPLREAAQRDLRLAARGVLDVACTHKMPAGELSVPKHALDCLAGALRSALSTAPLPVVQGGEPALDREALGRIAWGAKHRMPPGAWDLVDEVGREGWMRAAEAVASAVRKGEGLTHPDRLKQIADLVSGLPHSGEPTEPALDLGPNADAFALVTELRKQHDGCDVQMEGERRFVHVYLNGLWIGASMPKTEGK